MLAAAGPDASSWQRCSQQPACIYGSDTASRDVSTVELPAHRHFAPAQVDSFHHIDDVDDDDDNVIITTTTVA